MSSLFAILRNRRLTSIPLARFVEVCGGGSGGRIEADDDQSQAFDIPRICRVGEYY